ncbi:hypothetical protein JX265_004919 [Neoarthrinium moseri]|uniref:Uncharacterized protein n=1 Tax=Neoarthrinium moseri TaxID=1658444 RepID=A0A9P9WQB8_9PEZI|nr:uncharacterized protein JN550_011878 [Neoarthrinium moseri]KAI1850887.1 hypothetical protein JX266_003552 [Neoarthrinium moseri]KAI1859683.1 hypothetical protein JN550_011878 [Neoarthrinium moseri]KAI1874711.1 hypothetical protein JX265_004919 [Neoarthrinium moseri]
MTPHEVLHKVLHWQGRLEDRTRRKRRTGDVLAYTAARISEVALQNPDDPFSDMSSSATGVFAMRPSQRLSPPRLQQQP